MDQFMFKDNDLPKDNEAQPQFCFSCDGYVDGSGPNDCYSSCDTSCQNACHTTCVALCVDICSSNCSNFCCGYLTFY